MGQLWSILRSGLYSRMSREGLGFEIRNSGFVLERGYCLAYAKACDEVNPLLLGDDAEYASPLFASRVLRDALEEVLFAPGLKVNMVKLVHAEQSFTFHEPLRIGMALVPVARVVDIRDVSSGQILDVDVALEQAGQPVVTGRSSMFIRGKQKRDTSRTKEPKAPEPEMSPVATFKVAIDQPKRYAAASGDFNPIHVNMLAAKISGFKRPIAHGLCVMAMTVRELLSVYGDSNPSSLRRVSLRFAKPVYPGQELTLKTLQEGKTVKFGVELKPGTWGISHGEAEFR